MGYRMIEKISIDKRLVKYQFWIWKYRLEYQKTTHNIVDGNLHKAETAFVALGEN